MKLSALVVAHNEETRLAACLEKLAFADEIVTVLDRCTDRSRAIALAHRARLVEGAWELEGPRRNAGLDACTGDWILEVDADEHVTPELAAEIRRTIEMSPDALHLIPVDNWVGSRLVRYGWGASFGKGAYLGLFRRGAKRWGGERVHPKLTLAGTRGAMLTARLQHYLDRDLSDMIRRFDRYTTARAKDLRELGQDRVGRGQCATHLQPLLEMLCRARRMARGRARFPDRRSRRPLSVRLVSQGEIRPVTLSVVMADDGIAFDGRVKDQQPLGGAETAFAELAEALAARGHRVTAFTRCPAPLEWKGVYWTPLASGVPERADIYVANRSWRLIGACPAAACALFWLHNPARYLLKWRYQWRLLRRRPTMVFIGPHHLSTYPAWAAGGRRVVIPYGISAPFLGASERPAPGPRAVFLSNPQRSLDWLLDLWTGAIRVAVPAAELHIFGGAAVYGALGATQQGRAAPVLERARGLAGDGVVLRGAFGKSALAHELEQARVFLYRGDPGETFCNAAAEPQAMGVPGVVEDIACMAERIRHGETGFVVKGPQDFASAAMRLLTDDALWQEYHRNCLRFQRSWTWADAAAAFERLAPSGP